MLLLLLLLLLLMCRHLSAAVPEIIYEGTKCRHPMTLLKAFPVRLDANIFTGKGQPCILWESGHFLRPPASFSHARSKENCSDFDTGNFRHGKWVTADAQCTPQWLEPLALRSALSNLTFVFAGDSLVRQLFLRLVSYIRGIPDQVERPFHTDAVYALNATHDIFFNGMTWAEHMLPNPLFIAHFYWDHQATGHAKARKLVKDYSVRVLGFHYHMGDEGWMSRVPRDYGGDNRTLFMTTPRNDNIRDNDTSYDLRNAWISQQPHLPLEAMARTRVFSRNYEDNLHFQCTFDCKALFEDVFATDPLPELRERLRMPPSGDCRDLVNLNMIMMTTHFAHGLLL